MEGRDVGEAARGRSQIADLQFAICNLRSLRVCHLSPQALLNNHVHASIPIHQQQIEAAESAPGAP